MSSHWWQPKTAHLGGWRMRTATGTRIAPPPSTPAGKESPPAFLTVGRRQPIGWRRPFERSPRPRPLSLHAVIATTASGHSRSRSIDHAGLRRNAPMNAARIAHRPDTALPLRVSRPEPGATHPKTSSFRPRQVFSVTPAVQVAPPLNRPWQEGQRGRRRPRGCHRAALRAITMAGVGFRCPRTFRERQSGRDV